jgi:hypothetical protein
MSWPLTLAIACALSSCPKLAQIGPGLSAYRRPAAPHCLRIGEFSLSRPLAAMANREVTLTASIHEEKTK